MPRVRRFATICFPNTRRIGPQCRTISGARSSRFTKRCGRSAGRSSKFPGIEADDVIATLARRASEQQFRTIVSTSDKDLAQLVNEHVTLVNTMSNETLDVAGVERKFGVPPQRIVDYLTLVGDSVDNVPGVDKVGPKTAAKWLHEYGSLDDLVANAHAVKGAVGENLRKALPWLPTARKLVTIRDDCDLGKEFESIESLAVQPQDVEKLRELYTRYEFKAWLREIDSAAVAKALERRYCQRRSCRRRAGPARRRLRNHFVVRAARSMAGKDRLGRSDLDRYSRPRRSIRSRRSWSEFRCQSKHCARATSRSRIAMRVRRNSCRWTTCSSSFGRGSKARINASLATT